MKTASRHRRRTVAGLLAGAIFLASAGVALADEISNNLDTSVDAAAEVMNLTVGGGNATTTLRVVTQNGDGKNGCNLTGSTTLVVSVASSNTSVATVSPSSITFESCGDTPTLTVTPVGAGSATVSLSQTSNNTGGAFDLAPATFTADVTAGDTTAPVVTIASVSGTGTTATDTSSPFDVYTNVGTSITWSADEAGTYAVKLGGTGCGDATAVTVGSNLSGSYLSGSVTSIVGAAALSEGANTIRVCITDASSNTGSASASAFKDTVAPSASATPSGFTNGQVFYVGKDTPPTAPDVTCSTNDASPSSGIQTSSVKTAPTNTGSLGVFTWSCSGPVDNAGNSGSAVTAGYSVLYEHDGGIGQPINPDGSSVFNIKRAVPVKFQLANDEPTGFPVTGFTLYRTNVACDVNDTVDEVPELASQPLQASTSWRYDSVSDQYVFNASISNTVVGRCYKFRVALGDGTWVESAPFKVGK